MSARTIIQLARGGDILSILPVAWWWSQQGMDVGILTRPEYESLFASITYAHPILYDAPRNGVHQALAYAQQNHLPEPWPVQVDGNPKPLDHPARNFIVEQWTRAGELERFHRLPLVFDRRDYRADRQIATNHIGQLGRKVIGYCLQGISSPFNDASLFAAWLRETFADRYTLVDLGSIHLASVVDLLPILAHCDRLVTIDTAIMHLGYACRVPTIGLSLPATWYRSEPHAHWVEHLTYPEATTAEGRERVRRAVEDDPSRFGIWKGCTGLREPMRRVLHVVNWYHDAAAATRQRMERARRSWEELANADCDYERLEHHTDKTRHSGSLGDPRNLPFVHDIFDWACQQSRLDDVVLFTNSDIGLCLEAAVEIRMALDGRPCCYGNPADCVLPMKPRAHRHHLARSLLACSGIGLFAFTPRWWHEVRDTIPPVLLGAEGWDAVLRWTMLAHNPLACLQPPVCWHERHAAYWEQHITDAPAQKHNRALCRQWAIDHGRGRWLDAGRYLFGVAPK